MTDLQAEHVTPYGAWFTFRVPKSSQYGVKPVIAFSTSASEMATETGFSAAVERGDSVTARVDQKVGDRIAQPFIVTSMTPGTKYYVSVRIDDGPRSKPLAIQTAPAPGLKARGAYPRAFASDELFSTLQQRDKANDAAWAAWKKSLLAKLPTTFAGESDPDIYDSCNTAAVLAQATGSADLATRAKTLHAQTVARWQKDDFGGNEYRWADAALGICTDLLGALLTTDARNQAIDASITADERRAFGDQVQTRIVDTDEYQSSTRTWLIDGLLGCNGPGVPQALSDRACKILDVGMRRFYGVLLVQARRDRGFFAMSGGHMPDGTKYGVGSSLYWVQAFWSVTQAGFPTSEYFPWIAHNFAFNYVHPVTPRRGGLATYGDIETYADNFAVEPNSIKVDVYGLGTAAMDLGLFQAVGRPREAAWVRAVTARYLPQTDGYPAHWSFLLFDTADVAAKDVRTEGSPSFYDSGFGMFYDRTSFGDDASMFISRAGWGGVDHTQEEQGHFQLYRRGTWITHESICYGQDASRSAGHNGPLVEIAFDGKNRRFGQYIDHAQGQPTFVRVSRTRDYAYTSANLTDVYASPYYQFTEVTGVARSLFWKKGSETAAGAAGADVIFVYDVVTSKPGGASPAMQFHFDTAPTIDGLKATMALAGSPKKQRAEVTILSPSTTVVSSLAPDGAPGNSNDAVYTYRVQAKPPAADAGEMLAVLAGLDADAPALPTSLAGREGSWIAGAAGDTIVAFPRPSFDPSKPPALTLANSSGKTVYVTGLAPRTKYTVSKSAAGGGVVLTLAAGDGAASDDGGVLVVPSL